MSHAHDPPTWRYGNTEAELLDYHLSMLVDEPRMRAFAAAVRRSVRPGDVVLDIGAGTGVLSFLACSAGASRVYAVEQGPVIELARELSARNGFDDRVVFINDWSTEIELPEPADVVVTETIGNAALDEGIIAWTIDARHRLLRHGGLVVPQRIRLCTAAVESWDDHAQVSDWSAPSLPVDFSMIRELATRTIWPVEVRADQLLTAPAMAADVDLRVATDASVMASGTAVVSRDGTLHGLACWFEAELVDGVALDNAPPTATPSWNQGYLPVAQPLAVTIGDTLEWEISISPGGHDWSWSVGPTSVDS